MIFKIKVKLTSKDFSLHYFIDIYLLHVSWRTLVTVVWHNIIFLDNPIVFFIHFKAHCWNYFRFRRKVDDDILKFMT